MIYKLKGYHIDLNNIKNIEKSSDPSISINFKNKTGVTIPFDSNQEAKGEMAQLLKVWNNYLIDKQFKPKEENQ